MLTDPTPGLPYIAAPGADVAALRAALAEAIRRFVPMEAGDYRVVAERFAKAAAAFGAGLVNRRARCRFRAGFL